MSDLISRQAAIEAVEEYADRLQMVDWKENLGVSYKAHALNWCINTIRGLPSAQPEIIRCKDCKHFADEGMYCACDIIVQFEHFYCYYAERRTDE